MTQVCHQEEEASPEGSDTLQWKDHIHSLSTSSEYIMISIVSGIVVLLQYIPHTGSDSCYKE